MTQTYGNIELIVVDDGSTDESHKLVECIKFADGIAVNDANQTSAA